MHDEILTPLEKDIQIGKKLGAFDDFAGQQLLICFDSGIQDKYIVSQIESRARNAQRRIARSGCPFLPAKLHRGDFIFGYDQWNNKLLTERQSFNSHTVIIADSGGGKTNLSEFHAIQMAMSPAIKSVVLIDARKKEYRILRPIFAKLGIDLKIIRGRKFKINPLQIPYCGEPFEYAALISDILVRVLNLPHRSSTLLTSTIIELYERHGILNGGDKYPTLFDVFEKIKADKDANPQARQAVLDNLKEVLLALGTDILAYHQGWPPHILFRQHIVVELTGLIEKAKDLILNYLVGAEFFSRLAQGYSNKPLDTFIAIDEGRRLLSPDTDGENVLLDQITLLRGASIGLQVNLLNSNTSFTASTKVLGRCSSNSQYKDAGNLMGLNSEQLMWCTHNMRPGTFIGQVSDGPWRYPFLFAVPLIKHTKFSPEVVSDQIADESIKDIEKQTIIPA